LTKFAVLGLAGYIVTTHPFFDGATPIDEVQETKAQVTNAAAQLKETIEQKTK
jgi:outer membrane protein TolC